MVNGLYNNVMGTTLGDYIKQAMREKSLSMGQVATRVGVSVAAISKIVNGITKKPRVDVLSRLAEVLNIPFDELRLLIDDTTGQTGLTNNLPKNMRGVISSKMRDVHIIGRIRAGKPILAVEDERGSISLPEELLPAGEIYLVDVVGNSMEGAGIYNGDVALIQAQDIVDDNEIAAVLIDDEVTIKRVHWFNGYVALIPENRQGVPDEEKHVPTNYLARDVKILGKFVMSIRA